jgi:hypothetical protein
MMMDDLTQEEIKIIMDLRKAEIDNKIKIDKEKKSLFISLYLRKKQKKAEMEDLQKKYTEIQDIIKKEHDDIGTELVNSCVHYAHTKGRIYYDECFRCGDFYYCPACDKKIDNIHKYTNVWDEGAIIKIFKETKGEPIKDDPIKDDPIKDDPIKSYLDGNMTNEEITNKINTHKYNYNLLRIMLEMPETIYIYSDSD